MGKTFDSDKAIDDCSLTPWTVWRRGEKKWRLSERLNENSGASFVVSEASGGQIPVQVSDAVDFIITHKSELSRIISSDGVEHAYLDFGWDFPYERCQAQWNFFPIDLLKLCSELGLSVCVSVYACSEGDKSDAES